jgi:hypothetical protein
MDAQIVYDDVWGSIIDHPQADYIEIRWYDTTSAMTADDFKKWLSLFAGHEERLRRRGSLTDATSFLMDRSNLDDAWRDANIVPRYNAAGIKKFAFHFPEGVPMIGQPPAPEGSAKFPTAYFGKRADALAWLSG